MPYSLKPFNIFGQEEMKICENICDEEKVILAIGLIARLKIVEVNI
jgi:hypothetical protein